MFVCLSSRKIYTPLILYPGSVLSHSSPNLKHIGPNYMNSSELASSILSAICSLIHFHHLFTTHETCLPLCLKWQRSLEYVNYVFMRTGKMQASSMQISLFISTRVHQWSGGYGWKDRHCAHREITFNR